MKKSFLTAVVLTLSLSSQAFAHDAKFHKGPTTDGKIVSVTAKGAEIQTDKEKLAVVFTANTKFELGMEGKEGTKSDLKQGQHVMVAGHKLESGEISAIEIMIHSDGDDAKTEGNTPAGHSGNH